MQAVPSKQEIMDRAFAKIDRTAWDSLHAEYQERIAAHGDAYSPDPMFRMERNYSKYFDLDQWFSYHARLLMVAGLHETDGPKRILDLGCGSGMFLFLCQCLGHTGAGLDIGSDMYRRMAEILKVDWFNAPVLANTPLEADLTGFDMVTAIAIKFDRLDWGPQSDEPWALDEWQFFLRDAAARLNPDGHVFIKPNYWVHPKDGAPGVFFKDGRVEEFLKDVTVLDENTNEYLIPKSALV